MDMSTNWDTLIWLNQLANLFNFKNVCAYVFCLFVCISFPKDN